MAKNCKKWYKMSQIPFWNPSKIVYHFWRENTLFENVAFLILTFSTDFCPIKTDLPGNTVWPQSSGFQKLTKIDHFQHFWLTYVHSKCKHSSLRLQCWMRLFSVIFKHCVKWDFFQSDFQRLCDMRSWEQIKLCTSESTAGAAAVSRFHVFKRREIDVERRNHGFSGSIL